MGASFAGKSNMDRSSAQAGKQEDYGNSTTRPLSIQASSNDDSGQSNIRVMENQPRQPTNLQGLLRFAMEATRLEDAPHQSQLQPLDEERKQFLNEALSSLTVNVIEELQKAVKILSKVVDLKVEDDCLEQEAALERISEFVDNMDIANDFYKIGGFSIFGPCLNSPHSGIRWRTADVIAELAQNNPYCQDKLLETGLFPILLNMIDSDPSDTAKIKALYAISCIARGHPSSLKYMELNDGYSVLLRAMQSSIGKLQIKSAFLLASLCNRDTNEILKMKLVNMGLIEQVVCLLTMDNLLTDIREQLLYILDGLTSNNFLPALRECRRPELCIKPLLQRYINEIIPSESEDEISICQQLLDRLFAESETNQEI